MTSFVRSNPLVYLFIKMWKYSSGNRKMVALFWILFVFSVLIDLFATPLVWANIVDTVSKEGIQDTNLNKLLALIGTTVLIEVVSWCFHGPGRVYERENAFQVRANYRKFLLQGVMGLPMEWHVDHHSGDTIDKIEKGTNALYSFSEATFQVVYAVVRLVGSYVMLAILSPSSAYIVLGMMVITMWITMRFDKVLVKQYRELSRSENKVSESVFDAVSNISTVIILRVEKLVFTAIVHTIEAPFALFKRNNIRNEIKWFLTSMCCVVMVALVLIAYCFANIGTKKEVMLLSVFLLINYLGKVSDLFYTFTTMYGDVLKRRAAVSNSEELTRNFKEVSFVNHMLPKNWKCIDVKDLTFSYQSAEGGDLHLDEVSLSIRRGERVAFIGETGSGKTTCLKVMRNLYHPRSLNLSVDGVCVTEGFEGIRQDISLVQQNAELFATTVHRNITLGAEYDDDFVMKHIIMACFGVVIETLPLGLRTSIKEKGVNLSGGQAQRLALARGLLASHDKSIVLLDEPTSSLDAATEMTVYNNIFRAWKDKTIISTIHRLHLLPLFDRIYMFEGGKVIACGTLAELLQESKEFQALWQKSLAVTSE